ncbi:hypothetical protein JCM6882_000227 [Rhodosporidiobolus microsporus]
MAQPTPRLGISLPTSALVSLFSHSALAISSLVFINSASPFVLSILLGVPSKHTGSLTSRLLLADELTALVCYLPGGVLSDRWGVKVVAVAGHAIVAVALVCYVQARSFAWLVAARVLFAVGAGTLVTTMSAMLSSITASATTCAAPEPPSSSRCPYRPTPRSRTAEGVVNEETALLGEAAVPEQETSRHPAAGRLAGLMGFASGMGALIAVFGFLRLPALFSRVLFSRSPSSPPSEGDIDALALIATFYTVALVALLESILLAFLLPAPPRRPTESAPTFGRVREGRAKKVGKAVAGLFEGFRLAAGSGEVALGYLSSFASRAQAVIVTAYIPLLVNRYLSSHDLCDPTTVASPSAATSCRRAYILSSILTGSIQLISLLLCPLIGYLSTCPVSFFRRSSPSSSSPSPTSCPHSTQPRARPRNPQAATLTLSFLLGSLSFLGFALLPHGGDPRSALSWLYVVGMGVAQAAGVVLSLALVTTGRASLAEKEARDHEGSELQPKEVAGALSGSYALSGGLGILVVGGSAGFVFDRWWPGAPFLLMALVDGAVALGSAALWVRS